jgi:hypothetical protein
MELVMSISFAVTIFFKVMRVGLKIVVKADV